MQNSIALRPSFYAPTAAGTDTWKNGVSHTDGETDVYQLPATQDGVAAKIEVTPRFFGLCASVSATDKSGNQLEAHRDWSGFHRVLVTKDPKTGLETVLDPKEQTVSVATQTVSEEIPAQAGGYRSKFSQDARQELDAQGNSRFIANLQGETETVVAMGSPAAGVGAFPVTVVDDRTWTQTELGKGQAPVTHRMSSTLDGEQKGAALNSSIGADGKLAVTAEDGSSSSFEMYLRV
jgi:hypothetical protein